ncbi:uncharacterized protein LOC135498410 [Lineus longissimus]|uniref:uncharacterized protein LOC135498410 n=1 Tax=Lineus longissimus TaxID=88925 RepID=UPI00315DB426
MLVNIHSDEEVTVMKNFEKTRTHKLLWDKIAREMVASGLKCSWEQCANKWKAVKRVYMETVDHNSKTGNDPKNCKFFEELNQLYGNKDSTNPAFILDTLGNQNDSNDDENDEHEETTPNPTPTKVQKKGKKCKTPSKTPGKSSTVQFLKEYTEKQEESRSKRHDEKMQRFDRLLDIFEKKQN